MLFSIKAQEDYDIDLDAYKDNLDPKIHRELGQYFQYFTDNAFDCFKTFYKLTKQIYGSKSQKLIDAFFLLG
jgi:hypothetical protein